MNDPQALLRDLLERIVRNIIQALTPALLIVASGGLPDLPALGLALFAVVVVTVMKFLAGITASEDSSWLAKAADRAIPAAAAGALAFIPADWSGSLGAVDWAALGLAALGSAGMALVMLYGAPPSQGVSRGNDNGVLLGEQGDPYP
jgi:hypothetical protein